ncbi:MAG: minor capsid protein [Actinomycetota bacterium]|nr:minor capsid protein [Actinomycetota bacterium]
MSISTDGFDRLAARFVSAANAAPKAGASAMEEVGKDLKAASRAVVPYEQGDLRDAAYSSVSGGDDPELEVGYSGLPYIWVQHEGGWINHMGRNGPVRIENYTTPGTGAKYLEGPWAENKERYAEEIAEAVVRPLKEG